MRYPLRHEGMRAPGWIRTTVSEEPGLQPGAIVRSATDAWGACRESDPVDPESRSGPAPFGFKHQSIRQDSNLRVTVCGTAALPLSY
jgi:hypothetical protein